VIFGGYVVGAAILGVVVGVAILGMLRVVAELLSALAPRIGFHHGHAPWQDGR
jgi:hypothetical protein